MPIRPHPGVVIPGEVGGIPGNKVIISTSVSIYDSDGGEIGFIQELSEDTTRRVERIRALSAIQAGRVLEQVPGPEDITIRAVGFSLYGKNLLQWLSQYTAHPGNPNEIFHSITSQFIPFNIGVISKHPLTGESWKVTFEKCWITRYSTAYRIRDLYVTDNADIQPSSVISEVPAPTN